MVLLCRAAIVSALYLCGRRVTAVVTVTAVTVTVTLTVSIHCLSAVQPRMDLCRGTQRHARQPWLLPTAVALGLNVKL